MILVLETLLAMPDRDRVWGLAICRSADLEPSTVYPILARLRERSWVSVEEETDGDLGRPARRLYRLTPDGRRKAMGALLERRTRLNRDGIS